MKRMLGIIAVLLLVLLSGCNLKEKIGENITEGIIEKASGGEVDVDINGDEISYSTEEGEVFSTDEDGFTMETEDGTIATSGSDTEWPTDQAGANLPQLETGIIAYTLNGPEVCMLEVDGLVLEDYEKYEKAIVDAGFTTETFDSSAEDMEMYSGTNEDGAVVTLGFIPSAGTLQITIEIKSGE